MTNFDEWNRCANQYFWNSFFLANFIMWWNRFQPKHQITKYLFFCFIFQPHSTEENKMNAMAEQLRMYCIEQVESMQACAKCYLNSIECPDHHIEMACEMDHPILWGLDPTNLLYWPAKCMAVNDSRAIVQFFGNHKTATIDVKDCLLYSREPPTRKTDVFQLDAQNFSTALKVREDEKESLWQLISF